VSCIRILLYVSDKFIKLYMYDLLVSYISVIVLNIKDGVPLIFCLFLKHCLTFFLLIWIENG